MDRVSEVRTKLDSVRAWAEKRDVDGVLIGSQAGFAWITGGGQSHISIGDSAGVASILVTVERAYLLTSNIEVRRMFDHRLEPGQALAWNPSITRVKSEDTVIVVGGEDGMEVLTSTQGWPRVEVELQGQRVSRPTMLRR